MNINRRRAKGRSRTTNLTMRIEQKRAELKFVEWARRADPTEQQIDDWLFSNWPTHVPVISLIW